jgi:ADP-dependent NAD(P)H-hydrate dehydratase / NAD(P)H-hydrate epimerase
MVAGDRWVDPRWDRRWSPVSLPRWMEGLLEADRMRAVDRWAIEEKRIPPAELMERAGEGLARVIAARAPAGRIVIVCGKGNNGGDGVVAARLLRRAGRDVEVLAVWPPESMGDEAGAQVRKLPGPAPEAFAPERLARAHLIVDALLGTGASGSPRDPADKVIEAMEAAKAPVVAADVPSGVDASTGAVAGPAVHAVATATFHRAKPGLWIAPGKRYAGDVEVIDIGIPRGAPEQPELGLIGPGVLRDMPRRGTDSTKFSSGNVFVIGGSRGLTGAPCMSALAAMRAGAGYVTVGAPASLELSFAARLLEAMMVGLPEEGDGHLAVDAVEPALAAVARADAVVLGPGLSRDPDAQALARELALRIDVPVVIDADGLNAMAGHHFDQMLPQRPWPTVLTPHAGELGRLLEVESREVERERLKHVRAAAERSQAFVVLKGDDTLVAAPRGRVAISRGRAPALATAGTGDVLSGVIGAMLAKGLPPAHAACAGVFAHLRAGQLAAAPHGPDGVIASDVIASLPAALSA